MAAPVPALDLEGRVALVTGGTRGIGRAISLDLAAHGAQLALTYRSEGQPAADAVAAVEALGRCAIAIQADGAERDAAGRAVAATFERYGRLDVLVNNAGLTRDRVVWKMSDDEWGSVLEADLAAAFRYIRAALPHLRESGGGRIVNISSINGLRGKFGQANYAAAKAGLIGLTKTVAREVGSFAITVNVVAPGLIETELLAAAPEDVRQRALSEIVLGRLGSPEDVAAAVTFLASHRARHITGVVLQVDGGQYL